MYEADTVGKAGTNKETQAIVYLTLCGISEAQNTDKKIRMICNHADFFTLECGLDYACIPASSLSNWPFLLAALFT